MEIKTNKRKKKEDIKGRKMKKEGKRGRGKNGNKVKGNKRGKKSGRIQERWREG